MKKNKAPVTAIVVGHNEAHLLEKCLGSLAFCGEIIYVDLQSRDQSQKKAKPFVDKIITQERVSHVEAVIAKTVHLAANSWVLLIDPDEVVSPDLGKALRDFVIDNQKKSGESVNVSSVSVPWKFRVKGRPLKGTVWGVPDKKKSVLFNKNLFDFGDEIHKGKYPHPGTREIEIDNSTGVTVLDHYWIQTYFGFARKMIRYVKVERQSRSSSRSFFSATVQAPFTLLFAFYESFVLCRGWKSGPLGLMLSVVWALYCVLVENADSAKRYSPSVVISRKFKSKLTGFVRLLFESFQWLKVTDVIPPYAYVQRLTEESVHTYLQKELTRVKRWLIVGGYLGEEVPRILSFYPGCTVDIFEPSTRYFAQLAEKFNLNPRVSTYNIALGSERGQANFFETNHVGAGSLLPPDVGSSRLFGLAKAEEFAVQVETLDNFYAETETIDVLQLDVQGAELLVMKGAEAILQRTGAVLLEFSGLESLYKNQPLFGEISNFLTERGFLLAAAGADSTLTGNALFVKRQGRLSA